MFLSISGTHSVGKTTLANSVKNSLDEKCIVLPEIARVLMRRGFKLNRDITEYGIISYLSEYQKYKSDLSSEIVVSDRSAIDLLSYVNVNQSKKIRKPFIDLIESIVINDKNIFDEYVYIPIESIMIDDGVRPLSEKYRQDVDLEIKNLFQKYDIKYTVVDGTLEQRVDKFLGIINAKNK